MSQEKSFNPMHDLSMKSEYVPADELSVMISQDKSFNSARQRVTSEEMREIIRAKRKAQGMNSDGYFAYPIGQSQRSDSTNHIRYQIQNAMLQSGNATDSREEIKQQEVYNSKDLIRALYALDNLGQDQKSQEQSIRNQQPKDISDVQMKSEYHATDTSVRQQEQQSLNQSANGMQIPIDLAETMNILNRGSKNSQARVSLPSHVIDSLQSTKTKAKTTAAAQRKQAKLVEASKSTRITRSKKKTYKEIMDEENKEYGLYDWYTEQRDAGGNIPGTVRVRLDMQALKYYSDNLANLPKRDRQQVAKDLVHDLVKITQAGAAGMFNVEDAPRLQRQLVYAQDISRKLGKQPVSLGLENKIAQMYTVVQNATALEDRIERFTSSIDLPANVTTQSVESNRPEDYISGLTPESINEAIDEQHDLPLDPKDKKQLLETYLQQMVVRLDYRNRGVDGYIKQYVNDIDTTHTKRNAVNQLKVLSHRGFQIAQMIDNDKNHGRSTVRQEKEYALFSSYVAELAHELYQKELISKYDLAKIIGPPDLVSLGIFVKTTPSTTIKDLLPAGMPLSILARISD